jgi:hypothetical protein
VVGQEWNQVSQVNKETVRQAQKKKKKKKKRERIVNVNLTLKEN